MKSFLKRALGVAFILFVASAAIAQEPFMRMQKPSATVEVLQTKARRYVPANGIGPVIWLIGVAHVGQPDYYKSIQKLLNYQTTVLYEGVSRKGVDPAAAASDPKADPKDDPRQQSTYQVLSDALHLQFQLFGIDYKHPGFKNSDLSWEEMQALEAKGPPAKGGVSLATLGNLLNANSDTGKQLATQLSVIKDDPSSVEAMHLIFIELLSNPNAISQGLSPEMNDLLIRSRNAKVLSDLKQEIASNPTEKSIGIFFGAGHMTDMEKHLVADFGYKPDEERWFSALQGDSKKVTSPTGQMILQMTRTQIEQMKKGG